MNKKTVINAIMLPFRLPQIIADMVTPKVDILASDQSLERRIERSKNFGDFFGPFALLGFMGAGTLFGAVILGALSLTALMPALLLTCAAYVTATAVCVSNKHRIDCLAVKCLNAAVNQMKVEAETVGATAAAAPKAPEFNHVAATVLDGDLEIKRPLQFKAKAQPPGAPA